LDCRSSTAAISAAAEGPEKARFGHRFLFPHFPGRYNCSVNLYPGEFICHGAALHGHILEASLSDEIIVYIRYIGVKKFSSCCNQIAPE
jgi:hypothetical protein